MQVTLPDVTSGILFSDELTVNLYMLILRQVMSISATCLRTVPEYVAMKFVLVTV